MSAALERRVKKLEGLVNQVATPEVLREVVLMASPELRGTAAEIKAFEAEKRAAIDRGAFIIVLRPLLPDEPFLPKPYQPKN